WPAWSETRLVTVYPPPADTAAAAATATAAATAASAAPKRHPKCFTIVLPPSGTCSNPWRRLRAHRRCGFPFLYDAGVCRNRDELRPRSVGRLEALDRHGGVLGHRDEHVELLVGGAAAAARLADREDAEEHPVGAVERHEQLVLRMPEPRVLALRVPDDDARALELRPVVLAGGDVVRATPPEAWVEQRLPLLPLV